MILHSSDLLSNARKLSSPIYLANIIKLSSQSSSNVFTANSLVFTLSFVPKIPNIRSAHKCSWQLNLFLYKPLYHWTLLFYLLVITDLFWGYFYQSSPLFRSHNHPRDGRQNEFNKNKEDGKIGS